MVKQVNVNFDAFELIIMLFLILGQPNLPTTHTTGSLPLEVSREGTIIKNRVPTQNFIYDSKDMAWKDPGIKI